MGYESRIFVVEKSEDFIDSETNMKHASLIAMYNMSGIDYKLWDFINNNSVITDCSFWNGFDTTITKDKYGKPLREIPLHKMVKGLEEVVAEEDYRRYPPLLALLKSFDERNMSDWCGDLVVLHYGY